MVTGFTAGIAVTIFTSQVKDLLGLSIDAADPIPQLVEVAQELDQTSLATLALLTAGEPVDASHVARALSFLRLFSPDQLRSVYAVSLQTMAFAAVGVGQRAPTSRPTT